MCKAMGEDSDAAPGASREGVPDRPQRSEATATTGLTARAGSTATAEPTGRTDVRGGE